MCVFVSMGIWSNVTHCTMYGTSEVTVIGIVIHIHK